MSTNKRSSATERWWSTRPVVVALPFADDHEAADSPFGGYKRSGIGREFGEAAVDEYLETKSVVWGVA